MNQFSEKEQFFNRNIDKTAFDSLHSHSKFSSLGGSHSIDKKRRKLKNANSFKKKRSKATSSSKKSDKGAPTTVPFTDAVIMKNYRSTNLTTNKAKIANNNQNEMTQKRYQYHKRIRSETGNTVITPLEQMNEKYGKAIGGITGVPTMTKATTDITTPAIPSEDHRFSINDKSNSNAASTINTVQLNKYEFAPSFSHHKNISLDSNAQYRKFTTNKNPSNSHKIDISKIKKSQKHKSSEEVKKNDERSGSQIKNQSPLKNSKKAENSKHPLNHSPALFDFNSGVREKFINEIEEDQILMNEDSYDEYKFNRKSHLSEIQSKVEAKKNQQLEGDHTISISKETDELAHLTLSKQGTHGKIQMINKTDNDKQNNRLKEDSKEHKNEEFEW